MIKKKYRIVIITEPLIFKEVQQFQDFLSQSNKHGGWNEYNHNIFIKLWQKHFQTNEDDFHDKPSYHSEKNNLFINDVSENISGKCFLAVIKLK